MQRSLAKRVWYESLKAISRTAFVAGYSIRCTGRQLMPATGGGLVLSNHQSHFDPLIVGLCCDRRLNYVARKTLFGFAPFRWLIGSLDAIPIDREGLGLGGLKETLKRIKRGELVLLFPEGTRTPDGDVHPIKPGFCAIARRAGVPLIPVALDGAFAAWPKQQSVPRLSRISVVWGPPIEPFDVERMTDEELVLEVERRIRQAHTEARAGVLRSAAGTTR